MASGDGQFLHDLPEGVRLALDEGLGGEEERMIWRGRPSLRIVTWLVILASAGSWLVWQGLHLIEPYFSQFAWRMNWPQYGGWGFPAWLEWGAVVAPWAPAAWRAIDLLCMRYEITNRRLFFRRGVFNRYHDQMELHRIRDLDVGKPIWLRLVGLGVLKIHSVDRTTPHLPVLYQKHVLALQELVFELLKGEQRRMGYREFESTSMLSE